MIEKTEKKKMFFSVFTIACLVTGITSQSCITDQVQIVCQDFLNFTVSGVGTHLTCRYSSNDYDLKIISRFPNSTVSSVVHDNGSALTNLRDITGLIIYKGSVKFIPTGITKYFNFLKSLTIEFSGLMIVNKENLREFGGWLEYLDLSDNLLTSLDADLFAYNYNLKRVDLGWNRLQHIAPEFFSKLKYLQNIAYVRFYDSFKDACLRQTFNKVNGDNIYTFIWKSACLNETAKVETQLAQTNGRIEHIFYFLDNFVCSNQPIVASTAYGIFDSGKEEVSSIVGRMKKDKNNAEKLNIRVSSLEKANKELTQQISKLSQDLDSLQTNLDKLINRV